MEDSLTGCAKLQFVNKFVQLNCTERLGSRLREPGMHSQAMRKE
jgi:hypothetical protein